MKVDSALEMFWQVFSRQRDLLSAGLDSHDVRSFVSVAPG
jgi:hypothetical protein